VLNSQKTIHQIIVFFLSQIELTPQQLLVENDGISADGSLLLSSSNQPIVSNQTMVDLGKKLLQAASENDVENVKALMTGGAPFTGNWV
jgi:hypothetical protein